MTGHSILNITVVAKIQCGWLSQPKSRLSKVFNTSKHLFLTGKLRTLHTLAHNFVFSANHLSYLALLHPATILA